MDQIKLNIEWQARGQAVDVILVGVSALGFEVEQMASSLGLFLLRLGGECSHSSSLTLGTNSRATQEQRFSFQKLDNKMSVGCAER